MATERLATKRNTPVEAATVSRPATSSLNPTPWWCHCCGCRNRASQSNCRTCGRHTTWVAAGQKASGRPLHTGSSEVVRFGQVEAMLGVELTRARAEDRLLEHAGFTDIMIGNPQADTPTDARVRDEVRVVMVAADMAGRAGPGRGPIGPTSSLDDLDVLGALTGVTGESSYDRRTRRAEDAR